MHASLRISRTATRVAAPVLLLTYALAGCQTDAANDEAVDFNQQGRGDGADGEAPVTKPEYRPAHVSIPFQLLGNTGENPTVYIAINDDQRVPLSGLAEEDREDVTYRVRRIYNDRDGIDWLPLGRGQAYNFLDETQGLPWEGVHSFYASPALPNEYGFADMSYACATEPECVIHVYYSEDEILDSSERERFWEESPDNWLSAEFVYRLEDRLALSTMRDFNDETGTAVLDYAMVTLVVSDGELSVSLQTKEIPVADSRHPGQGGPTRSEPDVW